MYIYEYACIWMDISMYIHAYVFIFMYMYVHVCTCMYMIHALITCSSFCAILPQDYVMFIPPPTHYRGRPSDFSPSINDCWYGRVNFLFKMRVRTDSGRLMVCKCALIETMFNYCPTKTKSRSRSTAQVGTKLLARPQMQQTLHGPKCSSADRLPCTHLSLLGLVAIPIAAGVTCPCEPGSLGRAELNGPFRCNTWTARYNVPP
jgi:hypothetical protein